MNFSSAEKTITSSGILRMMSPKRRELRTMRPCSPDIGLQPGADTGLHVVARGRVSTSLPSSSSPSRAGIESSWWRQLREAVFPQPSASSAFHRKSISSMALLPFFSENPAHIFSAEEHKLSIFSNSSRRKTIVENPSKTLEYLDFLSTVSEERIPQISTKKPGEKNIHTPFHREFTCDVGKITWL